ncbi:MAG: hypothetical protein ACJAYG_001518, partial [Oceanicoccus sp.]
MPSVVLIKTAIWLNRLLLGLLFSALVLVACYVSIGRYYIVYVEQYQQQLVARFVDFSGLPLTVGQLSGRWSKLSPVLSMQGIELASPLSGDTVLRIDSLRFQVDPLSSLIKGKLQIARLEIQSVNSSLQEVSPGKWQLRGYQVATGVDVDLDNIIDLILSVGGAELIDAQLKLQFANDEKSLLVINELSLNRAGDFRRLRAKAIFDESSEPLVALVETQGDPRKTEKFSAKAYLKLDGIDFSTQLPAVRFLDIDLQDARIDGELWLDWKPQTEIIVQGFIDIPLLDIAALSGEELSPVEDLHIDFRAEKNRDHDWQLWLSQLAAKWKQQSVNFEQVEMSVAADKVELSLPVLELNVISKYLLAFDIVPAKIKAIIETLALQGQLNNLHMQFSRTVPAVDAPSHSSLAEKPPQTDFSLRANLAEVSLSAWKGAPGVTAVNGYVEADAKQGLIEIDTNNLSMDFPKVYRAPLVFTEAKGQVEWRLQDDRVYVDSSQLLLATDHGPVTALMDLNLPMTTKADPPPQMTLSIGLNDVDVSYRDRYIPFILDQGLRDWLQTSVKAGHVSDGGFIYHGSLRKKDSANRTVQLYFNIDQAALKFSPDWPALDEINGLVLIDDTAVTVTTVRAKMFSLDVGEAVVESRPMIGGGSWLTVNTAATGPAGDALRIVNESMINDKVAGIFQQWQLHGDVQATLSLGIPIKNKQRQPAINVAVIVADASLRIPEYRLPFEKLNGPLNYRSEDGVSSTGLAAMLYGKPISVKVAQDLEQAVSVNIEGRIDMRDVEAWSQQPAVSFAEGETNFTASINVRPNGDSAFNLNSNLAGISVDLPAPFGKNAGSNREFWLNLPIEKQPNLLTMGLADQVELQLLLSKQGVDSGLIVVKQTPLVAPTEQGLPTVPQHQLGYITVVGTMDDFIYDQWQPVLRRYLDADKRLAAAAASVLTNTTTRNSEQGNAAATNKTLELKVQQVIVNQFDGFGQQYQDSLVDVVREAEGWKIIANNTVLAGSLLIPDDLETPLQAQLQRLSLLPTESGESEESSLDMNVFDGLKLDLAIEQLRVNNEDYGQLGFQLRDIEGGVRFENIYGLIRGIIISKEAPATLEWLQTLTGEESRFYGDYAVTDLGDVLELWHYERFIETQKGIGSLDLRWPGTPLDWTLATSEGPIFLELNKGRFLKASDTATGTLKVVGIINLTNV